MISGHDEAREAVACRAARREGAYRRNRRGSPRTGALCVQWHGLFAAVAIVVPGVEWVA